MFLDVRLGDNPLIWSIISAGVVTCISMLDLNTVCDIVRVIMICNDGKKGFIFAIAH